MAVSGLHPLFYTTGGFGSCDSGPSFFLARSERGFGENGLVREIGGAETGGRWADRSRNGEMSHPGGMPSSILGGRRRGQNSGAVIAATESKP
jgi:hypothetical protein